MFSLGENDLQKMCYAGVQLGDKTCTSVMKPYIYKRTDEGSHVINLKQTWNHLLLAARILAGIENPADICVVSTNPKGTRAVLKFALFTGATPIAGRYTPGTLTNQIQKAFIEPRVLVLADPVLDHGILKESSYVGIPVIAFCNSNANLNYIDLPIPGNNNGVKSIGLMWWLLAREVLRFKGQFLSENNEWDIMPDLFMYRSQNEEEAAKEEPEISGNAPENAESMAPSVAAEDNPAAWGAQDAM